MTPGARGWGWCASSLRTTGVCGPVPVGVRPLFTRAGASGTSGRSVTARRVGLFRPSRRPPTPRTLDTTPSTAPTSTHVEWWPTGGRTGGRTETRGGW